ncbi:hypothetical protein IMZ48_37480 [Candidatus Bathyarchaeota archaeon]|nr:hypothetical protein [Candidatus Bathyarchaeota archaeon]
MFKRNDDTTRIWEAVAAYTKPHRDGQYQHPEGCHLHKIIQPHGTAQSHKEH